MGAYVDGHIGDCRPGLHQPLFRCAGSGSGLTLPYGVRAISRGSAFPRSARAQGLLGAHPLPSRRRGARGSAPAGRGSRSPAAGDTLRAECPRLAQKPPTRRARSRHSGRPSLPGIILLDELRVRPGLRCCAATGYDDTTHWTGSQNPGQRVQQPSEANIPHHPPAPWASSMHYQQCPARCESRRVVAPFQQQTPAPVAARDWAAPVIGATQPDSVLRRCSSLNRG